MIAAFETRFASPADYTPKQIAEKVLSSGSGLEGERKQVTETGVRVVPGEVRVTEGAWLEESVEARWLRRDELDCEAVFPWIVTERAWPSFRTRPYATETSPPRRARLRRAGWRPA